MGIQGHHKKKGSKERTGVWYERYIVLTLPAEDHVPLSKRMSFRPMVSKKLQEQKDSARQQQKRTVNEATQIYQEEAEYQTIDGVRLPPWWAQRRDADSRIYYINNFKKLTQWKPPTKEQIAKEQEEMNAQLPPPEYDPTTKSKKRFEEVKRRSLIAIKQGNTAGLKDEDLLDVKPSSRPKKMKSAPSSGSKKKKKGGKKEKKSKDEDDIESQPPRKPKSEKKDSKKKKKKEKD